MSLPDLKTCSRCNQEKPRSEFGPHPSARDGLRGQCKACRRAYSRQYYQDHREQALEKNRAYQEANKERYRSYQRQYRQKHIEKRRAYGREYHRTHQPKLRTDEQQERSRDRARRWYADNSTYAKKRIRAWQARNRVKVQTYGEVRRARKLGADGNYTATEFDALCQQYEYRCLCCGEAKPLTADHVIPLSCGGSNDIANIQPLCRSCNSRKNAKSTDYRPAGDVIPLRQLRFFD